MKKITSLAIILASTLATQAQPDGPTQEPLLDRGFYSDFMHITMTLLAFVLLAVTIYGLLKLVLDNRIKHRLIEKGAPDAVVTQLLQPATKDSRHTNIKWVCMLSALGTGIALINQFRPIGLHSLAILCFCLAAGFLCYHFFTRNLNA